MNLAKDNTIKNLIPLLKTDDSATAFKVEGAWGSFAPCLGSCLSSNIDRPILYITSNIDEADNAADDMGVFTGKPVQVLPAWEAEPDLTDAADEIGGQRLRISMSLSQLQQSKSNNFLIAASVQALCQPLPTQEKIQNQSLSLALSLSIEAELVIAWLTD